MADVDEDGTGEIEFLKNLMTKILNLILNFDQNCIKIDGIDENQPF